MAGKISKETIDLINNSSDIVSIVGEYTKLTRRSGNDYWGCCPIHGEKTPSFHVDADKKFYKCFGCGKGGNVVSFIMEMEKTSYVETIHMLAKRAGIEIHYEDGFVPQEDVNKIKKNEETLELYERTSNMFHYFLLESEQGKFALDYIKKRGLTQETLEKFKLGYAPGDRFWLKKFLKSKNYTDDFLNESGLFSKNYKDVALFSDRLMFPIFDRNGKTIAFGGRILHPKGEKDSKYLNSPELPHYHKKENLFAFNFARKSIKTNNKVIICEGYMDCIAYHQCGIDYAVAPLGTALTEEQVRMLQSFTDTVYLSYDSDSAGQAATKKAIFMCRKNDLSVKVIRLKGGKDPAEIMLSFGKENLTAQVNSAILDSDYFLIRLGEKYPGDNPDDKRRIALEFFEYVDILKSEIEKESCLEQLCQTFNLKPEAVKRDFNHRNQSQEQYNQIRPVNNQKENAKSIKLDAELRGLIAILADLDQFKVFRSVISENDLNNSYARRLYKILEECFNENAVSIPQVLTRCDDESLTRLITDVISSGVYQQNNVSIVIEDTMKFIKKNSLEEQRNKLLQRIQDYTVATDEDQAQLNALVIQKMELDKKIQALTIK